jgi:hypothetical protein
LKNKLEYLLKKILHKPSKVQIWDEDHNDAVDCYSHGFLHIDSTLNFYNSIKTWSFDKTTYQRDKHYKKNFLTLFINIYYFLNKEDYKLQDASFTELRFKRTGKNIADFQTDIYKVEKFIRINKGHGTIKENSRIN